MDYISIPFPQDLYNLVVLRSGGRLDPVRLAAEQVENFIDRTSGDDIHWTAEGLAAFADEKATTNVVDIGDTKGGHMWRPVWLANGTLLRMTYKGRSSHAQVRHELICGDTGKEFDSISQWVRSVASGTARNAWHDVWVKRTGDVDYIYADTLRDEAQA